MTQYDYDFFVIGAGSGGVRAARVAAAHGARVAIAEEYRYGGTCVIRGCIPKKLMVYAAEFGSELSDARAYGWNVDDAEFHWSKLMANKDREIDRLNHIYIDILNRFAVTRFDGRAVLRDPHTIEIDGKTISAQNILVATGARPFVPDIPGIEHAITSNEAFALEALPRSITIVGGGYIAVEFAGIFSGLGSEVTMVHRRDKLLRGFDEDVRHAVTEDLRGRDIDLVLSDEVIRIEQSKFGPLHLYMKSGNRRESDIIMYATGRTPNTNGIGLTEAGVTLGERGEVVVDVYSKSSVAHIYAVGDCTDRVALTPVAIREGQAVADTLFGEHPTKVDYSAIPTAIFSLPPVATVGLSEAAARKKCGRIDIYKAQFRPLRYTITERTENVMMKMIVEHDTDRVVGVHMVGKDAPEIIQMAAVAVRMGATKADFDATVALHPTTAEEFVLMRTKFEPPLPDS